MPTRGHRARNPIGPLNRWASLPGLTVSARMLRYWSHSACRPLCVSSASLSLAARSWGWRQNRGRGLAGEPKPDDWLWAPPGGQGRM